MKNYGKDFEAKLKEDFAKIKDSHIERIYDNVSGYRSIRGRSDFIAYIYPLQYFIEAKSCRGNTFHWSQYRQFEDMLEVSGIKGIRSGIILWMIDHQKVIYIPVRTIKQMKDDGKKSFNIKDLSENKYRLFEIPSKKRRIFLDCDYSILKNLEEGD